MTKGTKYVDGWSRERIAWDQNATVGQKTAVLLRPNTDLIDTVYPETHQKTKWIKSTWQYVGDID
ncbi:hypothetical protein [Ureibacillus xyleni]|uniref:hypothetical protein n=1 Tax=Ureibacillus xyleni TaxID=614648 RepID=UPI0011432F3D|nr:hypothetical protein [Ureibacillus xyleni]